LTLSWSRKSELLENNRRLRKNYHRKKPPPRRYSGESLSFSGKTAVSPEYQRPWSLPVQSEPEKHNMTQYVSPLLRITAQATLVTIVSLVFIFFYDFFTQCHYFSAKNIIIKGIRKLSEKEVLEQAEIRTGMNILSINLSKVRKRLIAHPWVEHAEAKRNFPSEIHIEIAEHKPLAILDLFPPSPVQADSNREAHEDKNEGRFIINVQGDIFKLWEPSDPDELPFVSGLGAADICMRGMPCGTPFSAVMDILRLGQRPGSIIPNKLIRRIEVDREMGISLQLFRDSELIRQPPGKPVLTERIREIKLGYNDYPDKYENLEHFLFYLEENGKFETINSVDINHLNRIVVNPM